MKIKKKILLMLLVNGLVFSSCSPQLWEGVAMGLMEMQSYGGYNTYTSSPYTTTSNSSSSYNSSYSTTTSSSSSPRKCSRCNGTGNCKTCDGVGKVYDWGSASIVSKEKYVHKCGVCNGSGKCGVCDGKGYI